jgi:acyl-CoA dehydrogenase
MNAQEVQFRDFTPEGSGVPFSPDRGSFRQRAAAVAETAATEAEADREARANTSRVNGAPGLPICRIPNW